MASPKKPEDLQTPEGDCEHKEHSEEKNHHLDTSQQPLRLPEGQYLLEEPSDDEVVLQVKAKLQSAEECKPWVTEFGKLNSSKWNFLRSKLPSKRILCRIDYICHHSSHGKKKGASVTRISKDLNCRASLSIVIMKKADDGFPAKIMVRRNHSHPTHSAEVLSALPALETTRSAFEEYFSNGMRITEAMNFHLKKLEMDCDEEELANGSLNPKYSSVRYWHDQWREQQLGPRTGEGMIQKSSPTTGAGAAGASARRSRKRAQPSPASEHGEDEDSAAENTHYTSDKESQNGKLRLSSDTLIPETSNVTLDQELMMDLHELSDKIQNFYPVLAGRQFTLCFKGEDGDKCEYIFTSASDTRRNGERHSSLRCDECKANIIGFRYKCVSCADYDLCSACEALGIHTEHVMMRIAKPLKFKQAREMVQRCCDVMKAGGIPAADETVGNTCSRNPVNSPVENIVQASTSKEAPPVKNTVNKPKIVPESKSQVNSSKHSTKALILKSHGPSRAKASQKAGTEEKKKKTNEDRKRKAEASEDEEIHRLRVKKEPDDFSDLSSYYNSFTHMEPTLSIEDVKVEGPDPLETEKTLKVELPTSVGSSSWCADNYTDPGADAGSSKHEEDTSSVCVTYTHLRMKQ